MNDNTFSVYMHIAPNGKRYIGITKHNVEKRWQRGYNHNQYFTNAIQKYGWDNFEHIIIDSNLSKEEACNMEIELISKYKSNQHDYGYNISSGGEYSCSGVTRIVSEETRKRMSESHIGLQSGENHPMYGKHHTEESKEKNRIAHLGKSPSEETRKKLSQANKGRKMSPEFCEKMRELNTGRKLSEEIRYKMSMAKKGKPSPRKGVTLSEETKQKIRDGAKKAYKPLTEEQRQKISEASKRRWEKYRLEQKQ